LSGLPKGIIIVSGTNGKTTTTHFIASALKRSGLRVFTNHSGSNMTRGLLSSIARYSSYKGELNYDIAVLEVDEAYAASLSATLKPRISVLTNVYRDQLDRFGETDNVASLLGTLAKNTAETIIYNANDNRVSRVVKGSKAKLVSFGYDSSLASGFVDEDRMHDGSIKNEASGSMDFTLLRAEDNCVILSHDKKDYKIPVQFEGMYNYANITAAAAAVSCISDKWATDLVGVKPPYGRGEMVLYKGKKFILQLVKNPAGFRSAIDIYSEYPCLIVVNDAVADGRDVSWLWDVDFDILKKRKSVSVSGSRAYDMALRLKYSDITTADIQTDVSKSLKLFLEKQPFGVVFLTYTAMLQVRSLVKSIGA
jgi:lipid II isoglutaminyl synthase (glutamine-hydrolysing)